MSEPLTNWFAIIAEGDGAESTICCESELKQKLHAIYCACEHDWDKCETEDIIQTVRTLDSDDSWTHEFLPNGRYIWRDRGEDYTVTVATLSGVSAVIREAIEKTIEEAEKAICLGCANDIPIANGGGIRMHVDPHSGGIMVCQASAIRSLKSRG